MQVEKSCIRQNVIMNNDTPSNEYIDDALQKAIDNIIKNERYVKYTIHKRIINAKGDSFMGALCEVDIKGKTVETDNETNIFMKIHDPVHQVTFIDVSQAYFNELYVYKELSPIYASLQEEFNVPLGERYGMIKFYNGFQDVIALENMKEQGFGTPHRMEMLSLDLIERALMELAKFHALSFVLEHKRPMYFGKNIRSVNYLVNFNEEWMKFVASLAETAIKLVDKDIETKLVNFLKDLKEKIVRYIGDENTVRCLCHGDYRPSNILIKIIDGVISKVVPIDYQLIYYGSPVIDFLYFIFSSTDREFRKEHLLRLKVLYHDTLKKFLKYFNMNVETVYPRKEFERVYEEKLDYGLIMSLIITPILFAEDDLMALTSTALCTVQANDECKRRLLGCIEEFIEWGYL